MPSIDSPDMVVGCFPAGSYGYAMRYLLLRSAGTLRSGLYEPRIRSDGAAHRLLTRSGLCAGGGVDRGYDHGVYNILQGLGLDDPTSLVWHGEINDDLVSAFGSVVVTMSHDCRDQEGTWVWVDHLSPANARRLFPRARIFAVRMGYLGSFRNYAIKNRFEHTDDLETRGRHGMTTIDELVEKRFNGFERRHYKVELRDTIRMVESQAMEILASSDPRIHAVDAARLFHSDDWQDEYLKLCEHCDLAPDMESAERFIREYASLQYSRAAHVVPATRR